MTKDDIVIYSTHTCGYCNALKAWLDDNKVEYTDKYIDTDDEAQVTFIKDVKIEGFNRNQFATVLKENGIEITDL